MRAACLLLYWGGQMKNDQDGLSYDRPHRAVFNFLEGTTYEQLLLNLYSITGLKATSATFKLFCKCVRLEGQSKFSHLVVEIVDDNTLQFAMNSSYNIPTYNMIDLYIEIVENNSSRHTGVVDLSLESPIRSPQLTQLTPARTLTNQMADCYVPSPLPTSEFGTSSCARNNFPSFETQPVSTDLDELHGMGGSLNDAVDGHGCSLNIGEGGSLNIFHDGDDVNDSENDADYDINNESNSDTESKGNDNDPVCDKVPKFFTKLNFRGANVGKSTSPSVDPLQLHKGMLFRSKQELVTAVKNYAIRGNYEYVVAQSSSKVWAIRCVQYGKKCNWRLRAMVRKQYKGHFEITRVSEEHKCEFEGCRKDAKHLDDNMIAERLVPLVETEPFIHIPSIMEYVFQWYNYKITYWKAYNAKQKAIARAFGDWKGSYNYLPKYIGVMSKFNPGTVHELSTKPGDGSFCFFDKNFWAFGPSIEGFVHCRPVISIDATDLHGKYLGKLFTAMAVDANGQIFPLAFGFAEEESYDSWSYFLNHLYCYVVRDRGGICLLSDCHSGILAVMRSGDIKFQPPKTYHRFCTRHIRNNFCTKFKGVERLRDLYWLAATANQERKFNKYMSDIKKYDELTDDPDKKPWKYLTDIPLEKWTFLFDGGHRYGINSTNISEVFNGVFLGARNLPISASVKLIFHRLVNYFKDRQDNGFARSPDGKYGDVADVALKLETLKNKARLHKLHRCRNDPALVAVHTPKLVVHEVNVERKSCTCGKWFINKFPCSHVVAVYGELQIDLNEAIGQYYKLDAYVATWSPQFHPVLDEDYEPELNTPEIFPDPRLLRKKGRPTNRIHSERDISQDTRSNRCSRCGTSGHTRRSRICPSRPT